MTINSKPIGFVAWWGSFENGGETIGDVLAVRSIAQLAVSVGFNVSISSSYAYNELSEFSLVRWQDIDETKVDLMIFACGPIVRESVELYNLIFKFKRCIRLGLGVSLLPLESSNYWNPFDITLPRDVTHRSLFGDLASFKVDVPIPVEKISKIGICLRGPQSEYGAGADLHDEALALAMAATEHFDSETIQLDTQLHGRLDGVIQIEEAFSGVDLVITSRMHAGILALSKGKPSLIIDQIRGGAKVTINLTKIDWPAVISAEFPPTSLTPMVLWLTSADSLVQIANTQARLEILHTNTLKNVGDTIRNIYQLLSGETSSKGKFDIKK